MKLPAFLVFCVHFFYIFSGGKVKCQVPDELIQVLYSKYLDAVNSDEPQQSLRRVLHNNVEYNIHVRKLKEVNGLKKHNLEIKVIGRKKGPVEMFYINNPVEAKIPKAFLTLEEFKEALENRVNYKTTTQKVMILRKTNLDSKIIKPNITTTMKSLKLVRANYVKIVKGSPVRNSPMRSAVSKEKEKTSVGALRTNKMITKDIYSINNVTTENTLSISKTEDYSNVTEIKSTEKVTTPNKIENITTLRESKPDSNVSYKENADETSTIGAGSETTVTESTPSEIEFDTDEMPTEETDVETSTKRATKRSSLSRPLVFEMNDKKRINND